MVDSTVELSALMASTHLSPQAPVNMKSASQAEVLICLPQRENPAVWDALPPQDFVKKHGALVGEDLDHLLVLVKDQNGNHTPSVLFNKTVTNADGTAMAYKDEMKKARAVLHEWGVPIDLKPTRVQHGTWVDNKDGKEKPKYKLEGKAQVFDTLGGTRLRQNEYENAMKTGQSAPDVLLHNGYSGVLVFRQKNDGLASVADMKKHYNYPNAELKSTGNFYHKTDYIDARSVDWNTSEHRFKGYLNEGHTRDLGKVMVSMGGGQMFDANYVMKHLPHSAQTQKLLHGPSVGNEMIHIHVQDERSNTYTPIELASVTSPEHLSRIVEETGLHKGNWAARENVGGKIQLTSAATQALFDKNENAPSVRVQKGSILYPLNDPEIKGRGPEFEKEYPRDKVFIVTAGKNGGRIGGFRNAASLTDEQIKQMAPDAWAAWSERKTAEPPRSRFDERPDTMENVAGHESAYPTPAATPAPLQPGQSQFENFTAKDFAQARRDIGSRPPSRDAMRD
jgi:hypothetical protein